MLGQKRIHLLDELRGLCVLCMVFHHSMYTLGYLYGRQFSKLSFDFFGNYARVYFTIAFVMLCGLSCKLSHNNLLRAIKILVASLLVTAASYIVDPQMPILFGILQLLGVGILLYIAFDRLCGLIRKKISFRLPGFVGIIICGLLFLLTYSVEYRALGVRGILSFELPSELYAGGLLTVFGFIAPWEAYSDYYPLLPWIFAFFAGCFLGRYAKEDRFPRWMYKSRVPFLSLLGKNAFAVYLLHQPIIYGVYYILSMITGGK